MKLISFLSLFFLSFIVNASLAPAALTGKVSIDGSSTVFPITEAIAENFRTLGPKVKVNIGVSGTGGGFKKFLLGEIDINDASRKIKKAEAELAIKNKISFAEIMVAYDGLTVVINPKNTWAKKMTVAQLKKLWDRDSTVKLWSDLDPKWPKRKIKLYGPGADSGTFDYFTKAINGKSGRSRSNFIKSEDDNVLVKGVAGDVDAIGYFGFSYYKENKKLLIPVSIDGVTPSEKTINNGTYRPLSRPVFIYVNKNSFKRPAVAAFVKFYLENAKKIVKEVGYIPLPDTLYQTGLKGLKL